MGLTVLEHSPGATELYSVRRDGNAYDFESIIPLGVSTTFYGGVARREIGCRK